MVDLAHTHTPRSGYLQVLQNASLLVTEYRRAFAAEDYYSGLKQKSARVLAQDGIARADIPRLVFDRFYSSRGE
jgi:hypothetical protein